jgi:hypothetical protein
VVDPGQSRKAHREWKEKGLEKATKKNCRPNDAIAANSLGLSFGVAPELLR